MDPTTALSPLERRLLAISKQRGLRPFTVAVTVISVVLSLAFTLPLLALVGSRPHELAIGASIAFVVPALVAPAAASMLGRLLLALDAASSELHHLARTDGLTGVLNRRAFDDEAGAVIDLVGDRRLVVAMVDVDDFKLVNDAHGHATGDAALVALAARLDAAVDGRGRVGRFGGDEFVVVQAVDVADVVDARRRLLDACDLSTVLPGLRASIGVYISSSPVSLREAMGTADRALYEEKRRVHAASRSTPVATRVDGAVDQPLVTAPK